MARARDYICSIDGCGKQGWSRGWCRMHYMRWWEHGDPLTVAFVKAPDGAPRAFIEALPLIGDGCVVWPFSKNNSGYGQINSGGTKLLAHRLACERKNGPPPSPEHQAAHSCGNGHLGCVAPWHLGWKTAAANNSDMDAHGTRQRGESHAAKLTEQDVLAIRSNPEGLSQSVLGAQFGVSQTLISKIQRRKLWRVLSSEGTHAP